ncbi:hypothetical protein DIC66_22510 [Rhodoferax lacus]|uniref:PKD domain-containing protein n=2 Tax=Rhodoferax lacus TaxID=2184758 RepID=A0A3E1R5H6_9BURK|nr:hypothetical protein DIC66_22510 [Rhodoferax lacus]
MEVVSMQLILIPKDTTTYQAARDFIQTNKWSVVGYSVGTRRLQVEVPGDLESAKGLAQASNLFDFVSFNKKSHLDSIVTGWNDPLLSGDYLARWSLDAIHLSEANALMPGAPGNEVNVAVIDGYFRADHPDLVFKGIFDSANHAIDTATNCPNVPLIGYICTTDGAALTAAHGMNVAGTIAATQNNGLYAAGVAHQYVGLSGYTAVSDSDLLMQLENAIRAGNKVINLSLNDKLIDRVKCESPCPVHAINQAQLDGYAKEAALFGTELYRLLATYDQRREVLLVKSSGNDGDVGITTPQGSWSAIPSRFNGLNTAIMSAQVEHGLAPAIVQRIAEQTIVVGAFHMDADVRQMAVYTETPQGDTTLASAFILAPGGSAIGSGKTVSVMSTGYTKSYGNDYMVLEQGTSQAAPHVSGVAAMVLRINSSLTAAQLKRLILDNADTIVDGANNYPALNAEKAVRAAIATLVAPVANIRIVTQTPLPAVAVVFEPQIVSSPNGAITDYEWDFGDGTVTMGNSSQIAHVYAATGSYALKLKIKDVRGATYLATGSVMVTAPATLVRSGSTPTRNALMSPNGGETWRSGVPQAITWKTDVINSSMVNIYVLNDDPSAIIFGSSGEVASNINSKNWVNVGRNIPNTGSSTLDPAVLSGTGNAYIFMVVSATDNSKYDISDCTFALNVQMSTGGCAAMAERDADGRIFVHGSVVPADVVSVGVFWPDGAPRSLFTPDPVTRQWAGLSTGTGYTAGQSIEVYYYNNVETSNPLTVWIK